MKVERICEYCGNWTDEGLVTGWCSKLKVRKHALCIGDPGKALTVPRLFYCNRFEERQQGPFFLEDRGFGHPGILGLNIRFPAQDAMWIADLTTLVARQICKELNTRWLEYVARFVERKENGRDGL